MCAPQFKIAAKQCLAVTVLLGGCNAILDNPEGHFTPDGGAAGVAGEGVAGATAGKATQAGSTNGGAPYVGGMHASAGSVASGGTNLDGNAGSGGDGHASTVQTTGGISTGIGGVPGNEQSGGSIGVEGGDRGTGGSTSAAGASGFGGNPVAAGTASTAAGTAGTAGAAGRHTAGTTSTGSAGTANGGNTATGGAPATGGTSLCIPDDGRCTSTTQPQKCSFTGQWINLPACAGPAPTCSNGGCICTAKLCSGSCVDFSTDPLNCGDCSHPCSVAGATTARACSAGVCAPTCQTGYVNCNTPLPPNADDGCECAGSACCGSGCQTRHGSNGWEVYYSCASGVDSVSAMDACNQYVKSNKLAYICRIMTGGYVNTVDSSGYTCPYSWVFMTSGTRKSGEVWIAYHSSCSSNNASVGNQFYGLFGAWN